MREINFRLLTCIKFLELLFLGALLVTAIIKAASLLERIEEYSTVCSEARCLHGSTVVLTFVNLAIMFLHTMHANLFVNMRLAIRRNRQGLACCWTPINWMICKFGQPHELKGIQYFCRDRCVTPATLAKYLLVIPLFVYPGSELIKYSKFVEEDGLGAGWGAAEGHSADAFDLGLIFILFATQHFIFIGARIAFFLFITVFCCGCSCAGQEMVGIQPETEDEQNDPTFDPFKDHVVSFEYEQYVLSDRAENDRERQTALIRQQQERQLESLRQDQRFLDAQARRA